MVIFLPGIYLIALVFGGYLIASLLRPKSRRSDNILLSLLIASVMLTLWNGAVRSLDIPEFMKVRILDFYVYAAAFFWGPLLYLYVQSMTAQLKGGWQPLAKHLAIPIFVCLGQIPVHIWGRFPYFNLITLIFFFTYIGLYIVLSIRSLKQHQVRIQQTFSQIEELQLAWLKRLLAIFVSVMALDFVFSLALVFQVIEYGPSMGLIILLECSTIFAIGYFALQQPPLVFQLVENNNTKRKYDNSALDDVLAKSLANQLIDVMEKDQPYKRNDLKLGDLAELVGLSNHHLSQIINDQLGCNFYEFINQYRIEYAAELMRDNDATNITKLAFDAGFNNRVSFTNAFKKKHGCTPSAYIKKASLQQAS